MKKLLSVFKNVTIVTMLCLVILGTTTLPAPVGFDPNGGIAPCVIGDGPDPDPEPEPEPFDYDEFD